MFRFFYSFTFLLVIPVALLNLYLKGRSYPEYRKRWKEHFGHFKKPKIDNVIWVHAVSVGESLAAIPIVQKLLSEYPQYSIVVTTTTPTGAERIQSILGDSVTHLFSPYDLPWVVNRFIRKIKPKLTIIMETELWPNFIHYSQAKEVPVVVVNARLSARSADRYARLPIPTNKLLLEPITHLACQNTADAERFKQLGANEDKLSVTGSIKFDLKLPDNIESYTQEMFANWGGEDFIWVAGSTHQGEDEQILSAHETLLSSGVSAKLIIVPRHPERFDAVADMVEAKGFSLYRRTQPFEKLKQQDVYLCDSMGELLYCYQKADAAFVAGSLIERGGHNPLEPAALSKPVLSGPHVFNFTDVYQSMMQEGAAVIVRSEQLAAMLKKLNDSPSTCHKMGSAGARVINANRGAVSKTIELLKTFLPD